MNAGLEEVFTHGIAGYVVLAVVLAEGFALVLNWLLGDGAPPRQWLAQIAAGAALVTALVLSQRDGSASAIAACLTLAGLAHLGGYRERWLLSKSVK